MSTASRPRALVAAVACSGLVACAQVAPGTGTTPVAPPTPVAAPTASSAVSAVATPSAVSPATLTPTPTPTAAPATVRMVFSGDMLWHDSLLPSLREDAVAMQSPHPHEYGPLLAHVAPLIRGADVAVCHTEVPFAPPGTKPSGYPAFGAPASAAKAYRELGFDICTTASNHSRDRGFAGLIHTLDVLERDLGIVTAGTNRSAEQSAPRLFTTATGVKVGVVTGTYGSNNGFDKAKPWSVESLDGIVGRAKASRKLGADIVVAVLHAGTEYVTAPTTQQKALAKELADSGVVDLIVGHHAHTVQPITKIADTWVAYGIGNLVGQMRFNTPRAMEGILVDATFARGADGRWRVDTMAYVPLFVTHYRPKSPARVYPIAQSLAEGVGPTARLTAALGYVRKAVGSPAGLVER